MDEVDDFLAHYGIPGMKWGKRKSSSSDRHAREKRDGVKYQKSTYDATKNDSSGPIKKHYSNAEIKSARKRQAEREASLNAIVKSRGGVKVTRREGATNKELRILNDQMGRDSVVAKRKTTGEKAVVVGSLALGAAALIVTAQMNKSGGTKSSSLNSKSLNRGSSIVGEILNSSPQAKMVFQGPGSNSSWYPKK